MASLLIAMADGVVTGTRDSMADRLWQTDTDRNLFKGRECGNGIAINPKSQVFISRCPSGKYSNG